ncbi:MAG TPA: glycoside hydrolase family 27 protein, partial [Gemmatimonadaceae bacterium]|nr:glycoside hydrolase family 27 protein [Gemmatimonadaceae bacterium]
SFVSACVTAACIACAGAMSSSTLPAPAGLAATPPMGWNSWNRFGCDINESLIRETADAMVSSGMRDAGYQYVNIDDCWMAPARDANGRLVPDPQRFPHGIKALADYVHARGLKLGIYSSAGTKTCQGLPASLDHERVDAQSFADWGVDYLKYDNCNNEKRPAIARYAAMDSALRATGRPIVFSLCEWGSNQPWLWGKSVGGQLWRTTGDIEDKWTSVLRILDRQAAIVSYSGPDGWNDPDMLEVGNGHMTAAEYRAHFSLWAVLNAPLIAGNDLRAMSAETRAILTNRDVIAVDQDWGGRQGSRLRHDAASDVWAKPMSHGGQAVVLLNRGDQAADIGIPLADLGITTGSANVRDLWSHANVVMEGTVRALVPAHGAAMFVVSEAAR